MIPVRANGGLSAKIAALFNEGQQGVWFDNQDLSTMFADSAGTTPVQMPGQGAAVTVGLQLDKSKGLVLGPELVTNGDFSSGTTGWIAFGSGTTLSTVGQKLRISSVDSTGSQGARQVLSGLVAGVFYRVSVSMRIVNTPVVNQTVSLRWANGSVNTGFTTIVVSSSSSEVTLTGVFAATSSTATIALLNGGLSAPGGGPFETEFDNISVRELPGNHAYQSTSTSRPVLSARVNQYVGTETLATQNVTTVAGSYTLRFEGTGSITLSGTATGTYSAGTHTITCTAGTLTSTVSGTVTKADLRVANDTGSTVPSYQRVVDANTYDTAGFPLYLAFDGSDDWLQTNSINFSATDKMTVWAGLRKLSDATGIVAELSASIAVNNGVIQLVSAQNTGTTDYAFVSKGTTSGTARGTGFPSPITNVLTGIGDISGDQAILRINGTQAASSTADQGPGNYGNYPLYIGRRGGTTLPFNGRFYGLVIRGGTLPTDDQIKMVERYLSSKMGGGFV